MSKIISEKMRKVSPKDRRELAAAIADMLDSDPILSQEVTRLRETAQLRPNQANRLFDDYLPTI